MDLRRACRLWTDALRAVASIAALVLVVVFMAGLAATHRDPVSQSVPVAGLVEARPDTLAALRGDRIVTIDPVAKALGSLGPLNLLTGNVERGTESMEATLARLASTPSLMPTQGWLSSNFTKHRMHPMLGYVRPHLGIDVRAPMGTPIEAPAAGMVISAEWEGGYGRTVEIDHGFGIVTRYAHTSRILVRVGDRVERGEVIALVGRSGLADGPHLHYEVRVHGRPVDPLRFVLPLVFAD